jgi:septal ring factor EnvC (AmiA/AmiB activator)
VESGVVRLGERPEVAVCFGCAHFLHQRARAREDAAHPSPPARARDLLRAARELVIRRGWHTLPVIGPILRRLGSRLP